MSVSSFRLSSPGISLSQAPDLVGGGRRNWPRTLVAIAFLLALGVLTIGSLIASGDEWSLARAREQAPPGSHSGPIDPNC